MGLSDTDMSLRVLKDPINLQKLILDDFHARLGGTYEIVDPNNTGMFLIEEASTLSANFALAAESAIAETNALRAQTTEALARNMSDYDYVNMFSTPAPTTIIMTLDKKYLEDNAISYNDNYKKVVIPKETTIAVGEYTFGLFYPIEIRINKSTGTPLVVFDTTEENPLHTLKQNIIPFLEQKIFQMDLLILKIPVYQFTRSYLEEDLVAELGFATTYSFTDKFYAVRVFTNKNNQMLELHQTLAPSSYDPYEPTARIKIEPETNSFSVNIPQIYFSANQMGTKLYLEVLTCKGALDIDVSAVAPESILCNFNLTKNSSVYSRILSMIPTVIVAMNQNKIIGGSNGYDFNELRTRVINNSFHTSVLVTPMDFEKYFSDYGFRIIRYMDNLTNLIYFGYRTLTDKSGSLVPAMTAPIYFTEKVHENVSTITQNVDNTFTILPKTIYSFQDSTQTCVPLTDTEVLTLSQMTKEQLVEEFNATTYLRSPFHMRLIPDGRYSKVGSYNLMDPIVEDLIFSHENPNITAQMVATGGSIIHQNEGSSGYKLQFMVNKSTDLVNVAEEDILVYLYTEADDGLLVGIRLNYVSMFEGTYLYECQLETDYCISRTHKLNMTSLQDADSTWHHFVDMKAKYHLVFMVNRNNFPNAITENSLYQGIDDLVQSTHMVLLRQTCSITLGYSLEDVIYNDINLQWTGKQYALHPIDVPMTYPADVYVTDDLNIPIIQINPDTCEVFLTKEHVKGEPILDDFGNPVYLHRAGDIRYDEANQPIVLADRVQVYLINALMVDAKLYLSEHPTNIEYRKKLTSDLETYFDVLRDASTLLLERDLLYFRPIRTMGTASFNIGNDVVINMPLNMRIKIRCHVSSSVASDIAIKETIRNSIITIIEPAIENKYISLTEIATNIKERIDYIESVDVLGINGDTQLQTISIIDNSVQPSIAQELYLTKDNLLAIKKAIDVEFISA